ncbi:MAG: hypothetical protein GY909_13535 [Oligoflexia bacterium]|nr:hypothetical protein [Oligoflexia bacterium]
MKESKLLSFINKEKSFTIHFFEGQKLIHDLAIIHDVKDKGFSYFRDSILSLVPLNAFLKPNENFGLYVDSEEPYFKLKIEMNEAGFLRTLLMPETFKENPSEITGIVRLSKIFPGQSQPYNSLIELNKTKTNDIVAKILDISYQLNSEIIISENSDQCVLVTKLPQVKIDKEEILENISLKEYILQNQQFLNEVMDKGINNSDEIINSFKEKDFVYLLGKQIEFKCNCSRERMLNGIISLASQHSIEEIFEDKDNIETRCDYCKTYYQIDKKELTDLIKH